MEVEGEVYVEGEEEERRGGVSWRERGVEEEVEGEVEVEGGG